MTLSRVTTLADNGPPPDDPAVLYDGTVMHARMKPVAHRFTYRIFTLVVDIDRLAEAGRLSPLFSIGRFNLFSFSEADHGAADGTALRPWVERALGEAGLPAPARVLLQATPRVLGRVFDPLSIFYCYDDAGALAAMIYEVRNTFGERHAYVAKVEAGDIGPEGLRQERAKLFYVSPFVPMEMRYRFRILPPGKTLRVRILETDAQGPLLAATFVGASHPLTSRRLVGTFVKVPFLALKILGAIHWEAPKLWLKGVPFFTRPPAPPPVSATDGTAARATAGVGNRNPSATPGAAALAPVSEGHPA